MSGILVFSEQDGSWEDLQTITFSACLREHHNSKPFLVVCPLSVLHICVGEYAKFAPDIVPCKNPFHAFIRMDDGVTSDRQGVAELQEARPTSTLTTLASTYFGH
ncbi:uncharacterized protein LACBIDRAFT_318569 [Laccaria bicolor S238N-H82]|uniref:Predicted protein n=1 Tax=Laccaria bicolor (strain S238N-H82 / ATCC MYA-4686) TaxID=486041 RepID=B0E2P2_LACBS|nr:uncharacterized protein LACBIDRAFT_318569 [Laccaria bicolor S238N-H82]EDQ98887.1 predicted protein [Laccaria bicolor S238N-H82]|eukprot:XP_001890466.1 predicted protein [Laccaria bicolor S238N-H82]